MGGLLVVVAVLSVFVGTKINRSSQSSYDYKSTKALVKGLSKTRWKNLAAATGWMTVLLFTVIALGRLASG